MTLWGLVALWLFYAVDTWLSLWRKAGVSGLESKTWMYLLGESGRWVYRR